MATSPVKVFISHAEHDKGTIAIPLYERLKSSGMQPFVDEIDLAVGEEETLAVEAAMDQADIAVVILSPEYIAYKQPMKELLHFLRRRRDAIHAGITAPVIVPCFYRLTKLEMLEEPRLDRWDCDGKSLYGSVTRFLERLENGEPEADTAIIKAALRELNKLKGLENDVDATNHNTIGMHRKRQILLEQLCAKVKRIVPHAETKPDSSPIPQNFDAFRPYYEEQFDVSGLVLDFERRDGSQATRELELLEKVKDRTQTECRSIAMRGIAGVGKTSMLKGLLKLDQVKSRFKDGIYFMSLGKDMTQRGVIELLASFVRLSGGTRRAKLMLEKGTTVQALEYFRSWFSMKDCLFVVDDVWETKEVSSSLIHDMLSLCGNGPADKVLLTTRSRDIASRADDCFILEPKKPLEAQARDILARYSCIPVRANVSNALQHKAVTDILTNCCGLPLFLVIAGRAVRSLSLLPGCGADRAYQVYASSLGESLERFMDTDVDSYGRLHATLSLSIELLEERMSRVGFDVTLTAGEMHRRLSVLERQERVPMTMLQYLWGLNSKAQTEIVAREFEQMAAVDVEIEQTADGYYRQFLHLHDSTHLFATTEARKRKEAQKAHDALLMGYGADLDVMEGCRTWWSASLEPDGYIHGNLCRHLLGSARYEEIIRLLFNPEWIARMFSVSGIGQIERDFGSCIASLESQRKRPGRAGTSPETGTPNRNGFRITCQTIRAMGLLSMAVSAAAKYILANLQELPFQLYARLVGYSGIYGEIRAFLDLIEKTSKGPWVKSISCVLQHPSQMSKRVIALDASAFCMVAFRDGERIACGCYDGRIIVVNIVKGVTESSWKAHNNVVRSLATDKDGTILVSTALDFRINVWDVSTCQCSHSVSFLNMPEWDFLPKVDRLVYLEDSGDIIAGFDDALGCLVWNIDTGATALRLDDKDETGTACFGYRTVCIHILTAEFNGSVRSWDLTSGLAAGIPFEGHAINAESLILSPDGTKAVTGSTDGTARIWDMKDGTQLGEPFVEPRKAWVRRITMSSDGSKLAATCGFTKQVIRVWDVETRQEICCPMSDHESEISGISFLPGDKTLVTCSKDATVRIWDITVATDDIGDVKHSGIVRHVCFTPDGSHVVSASNDGTLRVWNCASGRQVGETIEADSEGVIDVAVEPNGSRIVSLSKDMTISVWDLQTRKLISENIWSRSIDNFVSETESPFLRVENNELIGDASSRSMEDYLSSGPAHTLSNTETEPISSVVQAPDSTTNNEARNSGESLSSTIAEPLFSLSANPVTEEHSAPMTRIAQSRDTIASTTRSRLSIFSNLLFRRSHARTSNMEVVIRRVSDSPSDRSTSRNVSLLPNRLRAMRRTQGLGKGGISKQAYLSSDGRRVIYAGDCIRVKDLSTGEMRVVKDTDDCSREGVLAVAGESTTSMPDSLLVRKGNQHVRLANGGVLGTFDAPVRHAAWAGKENLFCVGLENGRVGIMKLMNAEHVGGSA